MQKAPLNIFNMLFPDLSGTRFMDTRWPDQASWCHGSIDRLPEALQADVLRDIDVLGDKYRGRISFGNAKTGSSTVAVDHIGLNLLMSMGLSLYLPEIEQTLPNLGVVLREIEKTVGAPPGSARAGVFIAPQDNGVTCHFDAEDVFSIQLIGNKCFHIAKAADIEQPVGSQFNRGSLTFDDMYPQVTGGFPNPDAAEFTSVDMKPGSVLFIPRGTWHRTEASDLSLSISLIIRPPSAMHSVLKVIYTRMLQDPDWRRPLHGAWGGEQQQQAAQVQLDALMAGFVELVNGMTIADIQPTHLSEPDRLTLINAKSWFQAKPDAKLILDCQGDKTIGRVLAKDKDGCERETAELDVPQALSELFTWIESKSNAFQAAQAIETFKNISKEHHLHAFSNLVKSGYLKQLWFEPRN